MAKLFSHHDRFHVHAVLGFSALLHMFYRLGVFLLYGEDTFAPGYWTFLSLMLHALLHVSSFQFVLPKQRNWAKPMIWNEARVHNAIFTYRHLIGVALATWAPEFWWRKPTFWSYALKVALALLTCLAADVTTAKLGCTMKRTTNAMPYPKETTSSLMALAKLFYAKSQFNATATALYGTPMIAFGSVFPLEIAVFLMTLIRKGILDSHHYHMIYASSLALAYPVILIVVFSSDPQVSETAWCGMLTAGLSTSLRLEYGWNKYVMWPVAIICGAAAAKISAAFVDIRILAFIGLASAFWDTGSKFWKARRTELLERVENQAVDTTDQGFEKDAAETEDTDAVSSKSE